MPKVSQEYLDARRAEIMAAARRCFVRKGFHASSMQDVLAEAGVSTGAVYRYFPGKQDLILAIAEENLSEVVAAVGALVERRPRIGLGAVLADLFELIAAKHEENGFASVALMVWAESLHNPALAARIEDALRAASALLARTLNEQRESAAAGIGSAGRGAASGASPTAVPAELAAERVAALVSTAVPGFILRLATLGPAGVSGLPETARALA
ncbi:MAG TPA: TetR/AcrR family transcriptional regulator [Actinospica sp.]|jgi:AcrR family transcriptional regulator|nr:TetR/AcrR family transcriptional regulator [Actinospica sp.]